MNVLVAGGAGYVGSHAVAALQESGHTPIVLDTLELGHREACRDAELVVGDTADYDLVTHVLKEFEIDTVMHFAAYSRVGESMEEPLKYYINNVVGTLKLIQAMMDTGVKRFIFSSTAATYGEPEKMPIEESITKCPINVYGHSKLEVEEACQWLSKTSDFKYVAFRYFNACGAHKSGEVGEDHEVETHLIPLILQVPMGKREAISIFGTDYDTPDGTCIRDYIHVSDLADAHVRGIDYLVKGGESGAMNLGTGSGYSVRQIIDAARKVTGQEIKAVEAPRRAGDPSELVARADKANNALGWKPVQSDLETIIGSAWLWHKNHPNGYAS
ncbi:MAG: UDP-glucose 4-epimerase GalE [Planctomycetes bacterium]|nr:UDP-glucose 4-epimerase GalE [Planctomycetota bacterium]